MASGRPRTRARRNRGAETAEATRLRPAATPNIAILARFSDALSLLAVAHHSLSAKELAGTGDEDVTLRHALDALKGVYADLDRPPIPTAPE